MVFAFKYNLRISVIFISFIYLFCLYYVYSMPKPCLLFQFCGGSHEQFRDCTTELHPQHGPAIPCLFCSKVLLFSMFVCIIPVFIVLVQSSSPMDSMRDL